MSRSETWGHKIVVSIFVPMGREETQVLAGRIGRSLLIPEAKYAGVRIGPVDQEPTDNWSHARVGLSERREGLIEHVLADAEQRSGYIDDGWFAWPQVHGDTSLGFGGMAGQMITSAPTIVVMTHGPDAYVYFGGRFGYAAPRQEAMEWVERRRAPSVTQRRRRPR